MKEKGSSLTSSHQNMTTAPDLMEVQMQVNPKIIKLSNPKGTQSSKMAKK